MSLSASDPAYEFAAVLAWTAHVDKLKKSFDAVAESETLLMEKTVWAEELSIGFRVIRNYVMRKLVDQLYTEESGKIKGSCAKLILLVLDGETEPPMPLSSELQEILAKVDESPQSTDGLAQHPTVYQRVYLTLQRALLLTTGAVELSEDDLRGQLSRLLVDYIALQQPKLTGVNAFEGLASDTMAYLKGDTPSPSTWEQVFSTFKQLLSFYMDVGATHAPSDHDPSLKVSKLRELGNNLVANTCHPQAIQVYTDAIHTCDQGPRQQLPQLYTNRAIAYIGLNCFLEAVADLQKALVYDRTCVAAWTQMGYCQLFLGSPIVALKCYLAAFRSMAGEIYPYNFPESEALRDEYTEAKSATVMPQFVQKLVLSVILTVKRAEQQRETTLVIRELATRVRAILARLRNHVAPEDMHYLEYAPDPEAESLRATAVRADTVRPSILTPEVAQDIMASANVEASAVTVGGAAQPLDLAIPAATTTTRTAQTEGTGPGPGPANLRSFLTTLDDVVGDVMGNMADSNMDESNPQLPQGPSNEAQEAETAERPVEEGAPLQQEATLQEATLQEAPRQGDTRQAEARAQEGTSRGNASEGTFPEPPSQIRAMFDSMHNTFATGNPPNRAEIEAAFRHHHAAFERMRQATSGTSGTTVHHTTTGPVNISPMPMPVPMPMPMPISSSGSVRIVHPRAAPQSSSGQSSTTQTPANRSSSAAQTSTTLVASNTQASASFTTQTPSANTQGANPDTAVENPGAGRTNSEDTEMADALDLD